MILFGFMRRLRIEFSSAFEGPVPAVLCSSRVFLSKSGRKSRAGCVRYGQERIEEKNFWPVTTKKSAPVINGGQVALVLSCFESFFGGRRLGDRRAEGSLGGEGLRLYGRSAPFRETASWGGALPWAAKLFSINRICTVLVFIRAGLVLSSPVIAGGTLPNANECKR